MARIPAGVGPPRGYICLKKRGKFGQVGVLAEWDPLAACLPFWIAAKILKID